MTNLRQFRWPMAALPMLAMALIISAPQAFAQVPPAPPVAHQIEHQTYEMDVRLDRFDQRFADFEARITAAPAAERAAMQREFDELRRERDELRREFGALEGVPQEQWAERHRPLRDRLIDLETRTHQFGHTHGWVHAPTTEQMRQQRTDLEQRLQRVNQHLGTFEERIATAPTDQRGALQTQLQEMRQERDRMVEDLGRMQNVRGDEWAAQYQPFHDRAMWLETRAHQFGQAHGWVDAPTATDMQRQRAQLDQRLERFDQRITQWEDRVRAAPEHQRATMQTDLDQMRRERDVLRRDVTALRGVPAEQWVVQYQPLHARMTAFEARADQFGMVAADRPTPATQPTQQRAQAAAQPTAADMQRHRAELEQRWQRIDRDFAPLEQRVGAVRDEELRADLDRRIESMRQNRQRLQQDIAGLEGVAAEQWHERYRPVGERMGQLEADFHRTAIAAAPSRQQQVTVAQRTLEGQRERFTQFNRDLQTVPAERRAELAYELIQLRQRYDEVWREHQRMRYAPVATYEEIRVDFPERVAEIETDMHMVRLDMTSPERVAVGPAGQ